MSRFKSLSLYASIVAAMLIWAFSFIWTKEALTSFRPMLLITCRLIIASVLMLIVSILSGRFQKIQKQDLKWFLLLALFEPYLYYIGETFGLTMVSSTLASVIISTIPVFSPLLAFLFLKERIGWFNVAGIILSLTGVFLVIFEPSGNFHVQPLGIVLLFFAVFSAICYAVVLQKISIHYYTLNIILYQSLFGLMFFIPTTLLADYPYFSTLHFTRSSIEALLMLSIFASVIAYVLFARVVRRIGVARSNVFTNLIPVFTAIFSWLLLNEQLTILKWIGIATVVGGLFVSQARKIKFK
ncbi:MAG TPA: DMT family transporter [Paludibacteraceae bacterium]|nr:DMT family transporter [Paludibacteraceae bacterium]